MILKTPISNEIVKKGIAPNILNVIRNSVIGVRTWKVHPLGVQQVVILIR